MSTLSASAGLTSTLSPPPPPPGLNYIATIRPSLTFLLVVTPLAAVLVPILFLLFFFSTPVTRSQPIFALNVFVCFIGLAFAVVNGVIESQQILQPNTLGRTTYYIASVFITCPPLIIDSILLVRVLAFYPPSTTSKFDRFKILLFPIIVKFGRAAVLVAFYIDYSKKVSQFGEIAAAGDTWFRNPYQISEWTLQVADNVYCSSFFLYKLRLVDAAGRSGWIDRHPTILSRIRGLFYIALGNFIFPISLNVTQIVLVVSDRSYIRGSTISAANMYVSIIGLVFATVWTTGHKWTKSMEGSLGTTWNNKNISSIGGTGRGKKAGAVVKLPSRSESHFTDEQSYELEASMKDREASCSSLKANVDE